MAIPAVRSIVTRFETTARKAAKSNGKSVSRWIADQLLQSIESSWPPSVLGAAGAIPDFPDVTELRRGYGIDARRELMK